MSSVIEEIQSLLDFAFAFKRRKPDYIRISTDKLEQLRLEIQLKEGVKIDRVFVYECMTVVPVAYVSKSYLQLGYGKPA